MLPETVKKIVSIFDPPCVGFTLLIIIGLFSLACNVTPTIDPSNNSGVVANSTPPVPAQKDPADEIRNTVPNEVNGIVIGSSYVEVTQRFGKPRSEKKGGKNPCGGRKTVLQYNGIAFTMDDNGENHIVVLIEITSPNWKLAPGVHTGMTLEQVRTMMGRSGLHKTDEVESLVYSDGDGYLNFQFGGGKVLKITRELNMC